MPQIRFSLLVRCSLCQLPFQNICQSSNRVWSYKRQDEERVVKAPSSRGAGRGRTRRAILDAGKSLISEKGYFATGVDEIAAAGARARL